MNELEYLSLCYGYADLMMSLIVSGIIILSVLVLYWFDRIINSLDAFYDWIFLGPREPVKQPPLVDPWGTGAQNTNNTKENVWRKGQRAVNKSGLIEGEREAPPRATFFGKLDGNEIREDGPYELNYLNYYEKAHWEREMLKNPELRAQTLTK